MGAGPLMRVAVRLGVVLLSAAVLQRGLFAEVRVAGVSLDVLLLVAVAAGMALGPDRGAVVGFLSGLAFDLLVHMPLGLSALTYCLVGFAAGRLYGETARASRVLRAVLVAALSAVGVVLYAVLAQVMGQGPLLDARLAVVAGVVAAGNAVLAPLALRAMRWAWPQEPALRGVLR